MIFPGFPGVPSFFQVFQVEWEPWDWAGGVSQYVLGRGVSAQGGMSARHPPVNRMTDRQM